MRRDPTIVARDVLRELGFLESIAAAHTFDSFRADATAYRAAAFAIQSISEAVRHLPDEWLEEHPSLPWPAIKGAGNKIRHEYFRLDDAILWKIITDDGPAIKMAIVAMLDRHPVS